LRSAAFASENNVCTFPATLSRKRLMWRAAGGCAARFDQVDQNVTHRHIRRNRCRADRYALAFSTRRVEKTRRGRSRERLRQAAPQGEHGAAGKSTSMPAGAGRTNLPARRAGAEIARILPSMQSSDR